MQEQIRLIIHADDAGMSFGSNQAVMEALRGGFITSTSVMVPCPWFGEMAAFARENSHYDIGVHLTLTSEWRHYRWRPVAEGVDSLVDDEGFLFRSVEEVVTRATPEDVERECRAQIERALQFGIKPTHIDSHMGTLFTPPFVDSYLTLAAEYGVTAMKPMALFGYEMPPDDVRAHVRDRMAAAPGPNLDMLAMQGAHHVHGYEARLAYYHNILRGLRPGLNELIVHPALQLEESTAIMGEAWAQLREDEFRVCADPATRALIDTLGIVLTTWREVGAGA